MASTSRPVLFILGAGPGLALSVAHRFGREGYAVALASRSPDRHPDYLRSLADAGVDAATFIANVADPAGLRTAIAGVRAHFGRIDVGYYGPAASMPPTDIVGLDADGARDALSWVVSAVDFSSLLLPEMRERGTGGLLFAGGLSSIVPMPQLGGLAVMTAALRNFALTLHTALADDGVYAGTLTIGGLIENSDIHSTLSAGSDDFGGVEFQTLDPDELADIVWRLYHDRSTAEAVVTTPDDYSAAG